MPLRIFATVICSFVCCVLPGCVVAQVIAVTHVRMFDGDRSAPKENTTILIEGRTIKAVGPLDLAIPQGAKIIDGRGATAMPGLADMHVHLVGGWDGEQVDLLGYQNYLNALLFSGITTVLDTGNSPAFILQLRTAVNSGVAPGPHIYCVGPILDGTDPSWSSISVAVTSRYQVPSIIAELKNQHVDLVKLYGGLSLKLVRAISAEAKKNNLRTIVDAGIPHMGSTDYMDEGIAGFAHLPFHRVPDENIQEAKAKSIFFISTLAVQEVDTRRRLKDLSFLQDPLIADTVSPWQIKSLADYAQKSLTPSEQEQSAKALTEFKNAETNVRRLWDAGVVIAAGTDAAYPGDFQGEGLHHELELLVESGLSPAESITAATKNAAAIMNASEEWGTLEPGKLANLLLIDGKPDQNIRDTRRIVMLIKEGQIIDREKLKFSSAVKDFSMIGQAPAN